MAKIDLRKIDLWQKKRQKIFRSVPENGKVITYLGKKFFVYKNTFWPFQDSQPLVKNFHIQKGERVLDIGTGSGVIAIFACYKGAGHVLAIDINPWAVMSAKRNAHLHGFSRIMKVRKGNVFSSVKKEKFDVITVNLPFRNKPAHDIVAQSQWDTSFKTNAKFLKHANEHLANDGRIYFAHANFGAMENVKKLVTQAGFSIKKIGQARKKGNCAEIFYAFILKRIHKNKHRG